MKAVNWQEVENKLHAALQLMPAQRAAFVAAIEDTDVRDEVASLLAADSADSEEQLRSILREAAQAVFEEPVAGSVIGHFRVLGVLGRGGMGVVYLARDLKLDRNVALKMLPATHPDGPHLRRFQREARTTAALNHPNIVTTFEAGEWEGRPFLATELVEGETLAAKLAHGAVPVAEAVRLGRQILAGLAAAHQAGIVHRDVKPANVMVRADGTVKVLDFGLAGLMQPATPAVAVTMTGIMGTPGYASPEQCAGKAADARSDIYSFGCVLYEMLSQVRMTPKALPLQSRKLRRIISRCLETDPDRRYQSASELERELAKLERVPAWLRQAGSVAAALILVTIGIFAWRERRPAPILGDRDVLVLADFTNQTGDPVFDGTLRQALAIQLEQSPFLKIMDDSQIRQDLRLMRRAPEEPITNQLAHDICVRDAAAAAIEGNIAKFGAAYAITLQAVTCRNDVTLAREQSDARDKEHVLQAVAKAAIAMRARLGESGASIQKLSRPLDQYTTSSLEALQSYSMGYALQSQGQFLTAIPFFERATALDPNFAWAYELLAIAYTNAGEARRSNEYQTKAFALADRVSDFERLDISARYYWQITGELDKAIGTYSVTKTSYPRHWDMPNELSALYMTAGQFEKAVSEAQAAVRLEPGVEPPWRNLVSAYIALDRFSDAKQALQKARELHLDGSRLHQRALQLAYTEGDSATAESERQWYAGKPEEYIGLSLQAANADAAGERHEAAILYRRATEAALRRGLREAAADLEDADARADALVGNCEAARRRGRPALALAVCGEMAGAERLAAETSKILPNGTIWNAVQLPAIRAAAALKRNQPAKAIELLASAAPFERAFPEVPWLRGQAFARLGKAEQAAVEFRKILDHKGACWGQIYWLSARAVAAGNQK